MAERFFPHILITFVFGCFMAVAALTMFFGLYIVAIPCWIICVALVGWQVKEKKSLHVTDVKSANKSLKASGFAYSYEGDEAMHRHLQQHPDDFKVALSLARSLSKFKTCPEGQSAYELAAKGALKSDMLQAVAIFKEYLAAYMKPFDHRLTHRLSVLAHQYEDHHFATQGLESIFFDLNVEPEMAQKSLRDCIRICKKIGLDDAAKDYEERLLNLTSA